MKKPYSKLVQPILIPVILLSVASCNLHIEKRRYRKGYHVEISHQYKIQPQQRSVQTPQLQQAINSSNTSMNETPELRDSSANVAFKPTRIEKKIVPQQKIKYQKKVIQKKSDHCDIITFTDGRQDEVIIEEITETEIKYKKCNFKDGPSYRVSKWKVKRIDMYNGEVYIPQTTNTSSNGQITGSTATSLALGIIAFVCLILGIVLLFTVGGGFFSNIIASAGFAPAGTLSLVGLIMGATQMKKGAHPLARAVFIINLVIQILAIIFTILMFFI